MDLANKVVVITGAAKGVGRELALSLAGEGMDVALADIDEMGMEEVAAEIRALGRRTLCMRTDVRKKSDLEALLARTVAELGGCHVLVNNAGVFHAGSLLDAPDEQISRVIDTNLWGVIYGSRVFGRYFVDQGAGQIVNMASGAGLMGAPGMTAYSTSKFGVVGFSEVLRWELAPLGVGVTHVCPGIMKTGITRAEGANLEHIDIDVLTKFAPTPAPLVPKVVRAIRKNQARVVFGYEAQLFLMLRLTPYALVDGVGRYATKRVMQLLFPPKP